MNIQESLRHNRTVSRLFEAISSMSFLSKLLLIGVLIRLILMPLFGHQDILSTYERAYLIAFEGESIFRFTQPIPHLIEVINLYLYDLLFDRADLLPFTQIIEQNPAARLNMFFFKIPYLLFDLGTLFLLNKLVSEKSQNKTALMFYFLNPLLIFAVYIFGRYETIPLFFLVLSLLYLKENRVYSSAISMALLILSRTSLLILLPVLVITIGKRWYEKVAYGAIGVAPYASFFLYKLLFGGESGEAKWVSEGHHINFFSNFAIDMNYGEMIYPFFALCAMFLTVVFLLYFRRQNSWREISIFLLVQLLTYYTFANYHPQYLAWMVPMFAILAAEWKRRDDFLMITGILGALLIPLLATWGEDIYFRMFGPIGKTISGLDLNQITGGFISPKGLANIARSALAGIFPLIALIAVIQLRASYLRTKVSKPK